MPPLLIHIKYNWLYNFYYIIKLYMNKETHREANRLYRLNNKDKIKEINK